MILGIFGASGLGREGYIIDRRINIFEHQWEKIFYCDEKESIQEEYGR